MFADLFADYIVPGLALIAHWQQQFSPALDLPMQAITFLGALEFYLILLPFIYWTIDPALATRTLALVLCNDFISTSVKVLTHAPRPYWIPGDTGVRGMVSEPSYGVPSGHAGGSLVTWGYLALQVRKLWFQCTAFVLIVLIGGSRIYLGAHFLHDVLIGWLIGALVLLLVLSVQGRVIAWLATLDLREHFVIAFILAGAVMVWGMLVPSFVAATPDPAEWAQFSARARSPAHFFALAGTLFGLMVGARRLRELATYVPPVRWSMRLRNFGLGMAGMGGIYLGMGALAHALVAPETDSAYLLRFVRFALVAWWIAELAPRLFMRLGMSGEVSRSAEQGAAEQGT